MDKQTQQELLGIVKSGYEKIAEDFSETRKKYLWPELIKLAEEIKDDDSVLDAGCGNGRLIEAFKDKKINYTGVDSSGELIELAKERYGPPNFQFFPPQRDPAKAVAISNFQFLVGDILELDKIIDKKFDYIFCIAILHHIPGEDLRLKVLKNLKEKLMDDGRIILTVWNLWGQKKFRWLIFKSALLKLMGQNKMDFGDILFYWKSNRGASISKRYYHAFSRRGLNKLFRTASLKIESLYKDKFNYYAILKK